MLTPEQKKKLDEKIVLTKAKRLAKARATVKAHQHKNYIRGHLRVIRRLRLELESFIKQATQTHNRVQKIISRFETEYAS